MALITTNGQISVVPGRKGKQKGIITVNGQISTLIPYQPADVVADPSTDLGFSAVNGVAVGSVSTVMGVAKASISKINGV
tara:strand:+ start:1447 stop:1686 length:240 start_codon:yes stop_codon:yes gene_type:complete